MWLKTYMYIVQLQGALHITLYRVLTVMLPILRAAGFSLYNSLFDCCVLSYTVTFPHNIHPHPFTNARTEPDNDNFGFFF
jgi:hypothetical protein